jgi:type I site-specific restriction-modification system R (restriction) subunit
MADMPNTTATAPIGALPGVGQSTGLAPIGAATGDATQATVPSTGATEPSIDWTKVDWDAHADKIPWDKFEKRIEQLPTVRKMQSTYERRAKDLERASRQQLETLQNQLNQYHQLLAGQGNEDLAPKLQGIQQQSQTLMLQHQLERYQEMEARKLLAQKYEVPEDVVFGFEGGPNEVMQQILEYQSLNRVQQQSGLQKQLEDMQKKLEALTRRQSDPAANADVGTPAPSGNQFQVEWERLVKEGRGNEASLLERQVREKGINLNKDILKPKGWA